jgi:hypothetical protein
MTRWRRTTACERATQWLSLDLDGELGRLEQAALARHLGRCDDCRGKQREFQGFTLLLREAPLVGPERPIQVPFSARAATRTTLRGGAIAVALAVIVFGAFNALSRSTSQPVSSLSFGSIQQQRAFVRQHAQIASTLSSRFTLVPAPPFAGRVLL